MHYITIRSLVDIEKGELVDDGDWPIAVLLLYIAHIVLQHSMIYMYKEFIKTWNPKIKDSVDL